MASVQTNISTHVVIRNVRLFHSENGARKVTAASYPGWNSIINMRNSRARSGKKFLFLIFLRTRDYEEEKLKILAIVGSPRLNGNTNYLVDKALEEAATLGAHTEKIILSQFIVNPCLGHENCASFDYCQQKDDMG
jgi:hypothetical protein